MIIKECPQCREEFKTYPSINKLFCKRECLSKYKKLASYDKYKKICLQCGGEFLPPRQKEGGKFCSYKCSGISGRKDKVDRGGYWYKLKIGHPNANKQNYVPEHHLVMELFLGHYIKAGMVVHHIDEDKKNNKIENLQYMKDSDHRALHINKTIAKGLLCTKKHRESASIRMKENNPYIHSKRGKDGRYFKKL